MYINIDRYVIFCFVCFMLFNRDQLLCSLFFGVDIVYAYICGRNYILV
ncbi:MAG: hypothetical protein DMNBKLKJ_00125 [Candidatus Westeberhardia cardiocondylae]|nr:hypothetical protein [Candidatus Westeberhardia cardiocondylae]